MGNPQNYTPSARPEDALKLCVNPPDWQNYTPSVRPEDALAHCVKLRIPPNYTHQDRPEDVLMLCVKIPNRGNYTPSVPLQKLGIPQNWEPSVPCKNCGIRKICTLSIPSRLPPDFPDLRTYEDAQKCACNSRTSPWGNLRAPFSTS